jgi:hypothetical protein
MGWGTDGVSLKAHKEICRETKAIQDFIYSSSMMGWKLIIPLLLMIFYPHSQEVLKCTVNIVRNNWQKII